MDNKDYEEIQVKPIKRSKKQKKDKKTIIIVLIIVAVVLAGVAVFIHFTSRLDDSSYEKCALGDVNGDGYVNSGDVNEILSYIKGKELFPNQIKNGDVNCDGKLDETDADIIGRYAVGEIKTLPYKDTLDAKTEPDGKKAENKTDDIQSTVQIYNNWDNEDGTHSYQLNISVKNLTKNKIDGWKSVIGLDTNVKIAQNWDCEASLKGKELIIKGDSINAKSTVNCGLIVTCTDELSINNIETE